MHMIEHITHISIHVYEVSMRVTIIQMCLTSSVTFAPQLCGLFYSVQSMHYSCKSYLSSLHFAACPEEDVHKGTDAMIYDMMMMIRACGYACGQVAISHALKVTPLCSGVTMYM